MPLFKGITKIPQTAHERFFIEQFTLPENQSCVSVHQLPEAKKQIPQKASESFLNNYVNRLRHGLFASHKRQNFRFGT